MTSRRPCWFFKQILCELDHLPMQPLSFTVVLCTDASHGRENALYRIADHAHVKSSPRSSQSIKIGSNQVIFID